jgi:hypothetical protein
MLQTPLDQTQVWDIPDFWMPNVTIGRYFSRVTTRASRIWLT